MRTLKQIKELVDIEVSKLTISEILTTNITEYRKELTNKFLKNK